MTEPKTFAAGIRAAIDSALESARRIVWPSNRYQSDPVGFARTILGLEPWSRQIEFLEAVRDQNKVAVTSGQKTGKTTSLAILALWYYCTFPDARVIFCSTTDRQVNRILWREIKILHAGSGICLDCRRENQRRRQRNEPLIARPCPHSTTIGGDPGTLARTGLNSPDFRQIFGFTAKKQESTQGISSPHQLVLVDEASGVPDEVIQALKGNLSGGGKLVLVSNPTRADGEFFEAFNSQADFYRCLEISSEETPNYVSGRVIIPGLATRDDIREMEQAYGRDHPLFKVRALGKFVVLEEGRIVSIHAIAQSQENWQAAEAAAGEQKHQDSGRLFIGVDCAGESGMGDESAFAARRGKRIMSVQTELGLSEEGHLIRVLGLLSKHRRPREEKPVVVVDRDGLVGFKVYTAFLGYLAQNEDEFVLIGFRGSDAARRPEIFGMQRDEAWSDFELWVREGGMLPPDAKLAKELHAPSWIPGPKGKLKVTPKEDLRKVLGRSPDRADACILSCWEATPVALGLVTENQQPTETVTTEDIQRADPYSWERLMDPYGGGGSNRPY